MMRCETQQELEAALVFTYGKIKLQREMNAWKAVRICYYKDRCQQRTPLGTWDAERRVGWLRVLPWALSGEKPQSQAENVELWNVKQKWQEANSAIAHVMPTQRV